MDCRVSSIKAPTGDHGGGTRVRPSSNFCPQNDHDAPQTANTATVRDVQELKNAHLCRIDKGLKDEVFLPAGTNPAGERRTAIVAGFIHGPEQCCERSAFRRRVAAQRGEAMR